MTRIARVVPDVSGVDKHFDYVVPDGVAVEIGDIVRVTLHGRSVRGWIVDLPTESAVAVERLLPLVRVGHGPDQGLVELAGWAARRWCGPRRTFLAAASPERIVRAIPATRRSREQVSAQHTSVLRRLGPHVSDVSIVHEAAADAAVLVIVPTLARAARLVSSLRSEGLTVAAWPREWEAAAGGVDVVVGTRSAVWARLTGPVTLVVVDEHDEAMQGERSPTWHAREVAIERSRRAGWPLVLTSSIPSVAAMVATDRHTAPPTLVEAGQWPEVRVVEIDTSVGGNPLVTSHLLDAIRTEGRRVALVMNAPGRSTLLVCRTCSEILRCSSCAGGVVQDDTGGLRCRRCESGRPAVCQRCGGARLGNLRPGIARLREEIAAATGVEVGEVTATSGDVDHSKRVWIGTEAALHRLDDLDEVVILDVDRELFAPRFLASERAAALLVTAARAARSVTVQTRTPEHRLLGALRDGDLEGYVVGEVERRRELGLPPFSAVALLTGSGLDTARAELEGRLGVAVAARDGELVIRAVDHETLSDALATVTARRGATPRVEVDPSSV